MCSYRSLSRVVKKKKMAAAALEGKDGSNVVILHQLKRGKLTPCISPFALKLETYLRIAGIAYQNDFDEPMGPKGKTPWITLNGKKVGDSQLCLELLSETFHKDLSHHLSIEDKAVARAFQIMAEDHLYWVMLVWRWIYNGGSSLPLIQTDLHFAVRYLRPIVVSRVKSQVSAQGMGRHSQSEVMEMGLKDLRAISNFLGTKSFLMGDQPIEVDCAMFGMLAQILWNSPGCPYEPLFTAGELINLKGYCERMKRMFWPDWNRCLIPPLVR